VVLDAGCEDGATHGRVHVHEVSLDVPFMHCINNAQRCHTHTGEPSTSSWKVRKFPHKSQPVTLRKVWRRNEKVRGWRRLHNEKHHNLYSSPSIIRMINLMRIKWAGYVARKREKTDAYSILAGNSERKRPLGRPRRRFKDYIKTNCDVFAQSIA
jgi:hypothetical protein